MANGHPPQDSAGSWRFVDITHNGVVCYVSCRAEAIIINKNSKSRACSPENQLVTAGTNLKLWRYRSNTSSLDTIHVLDVNFLPSPALASIRFSGMSSAFNELCAVSADRENRLTMNRHLPSPKPISALAGLSLFPGSHCFRSAKTNTQDPQ